MSDVRWGLLAFAIPLVVYLATLNGRIGTDYTSSILGTQYALWMDHSFSLGPPQNLVTDTVDKGLFEGNYYSAISPGLAVMTYPFAALGFRIEGGEFSPFGTALLLDEAAIALAGALAVSFVYRICRFYAPPPPSFLAGMCLAFGTTVWPFATVLFPHVVAMFLSVVATYLVLRYRRERSGWASLLLAGWCLGLGAFVEYVALFLCIPLLAYIVFSGVRKGHLISFIAGVLIGPMMHLVLNAVVFGNPLVFPEGLKAHESVGRFNLLDAPGHVLAYLVSPYRGVLLLSPVLLFGVLGLVRMFRSSSTRLDATLFVTMFVMVVVPYSAWWDWSGGVGYGPRFMIVALPYVAIPIAVAIAQPRSVIRTWLFVVAFGSSVLVQAAGAVAGPFSIGNVWTYEPIDRIAAVSTETTVAWWILRVPGPDLLVSRLFGVALVCCVWATAIAGFRPASQARHASDRAVR